jgi:allantoicase
MNHQALNLHYVNGFPIDRPMPDAGSLLEGASEYGYLPVGVQFEPGTAFQYSGGGFLVLEHLLETMKRGRVNEITRGFFEKLGLSRLTFDPHPGNSLRIASGFHADGTMIDGGRLQFPAFAAGALGSAADYLSFLSLLGDAFQGRESPISKATAVSVLEDTDSASQSFMGVNVGAGVFIAEAGANRLAIHQGANDGFRALSLYCHSGPDEGSGFVILCNADRNGVAFVAEAAQEILKCFALQGVDLTKFSGAFDPAQLPSEQIVNLGYKALVFGAFEPDLPEPISRFDERGKESDRDPLASYNLSIGARVLGVSNQRFARAVNLFSPYLPVFDPDAYGRQGKIMDSWESARHNPKSFDEVRFEIIKPAKIHQVAFSTAFHSGNHAPEVELWGERSDGSLIPLVARLRLQGHALIRVEAEPTESEVQVFRIRMFPDGGLTRVAFYSSTGSNPLPPAQAVSEPYPMQIPQTHKPLVPRYPVTASRILHNWRRFKKGSLVDLACSALGGRILSASNEHYGPAVQLISPYPPLHMFDGFESARSRRPGHQEEVVVELAREARLEKIEIDFTYFRNNNPRELEIIGLSPKGWVPVLEKMRVKAFAGNRLLFQPKTGEPVSQLKIRVIPDGGMNRLRAYSRVP